MQGIQSHKSFQKSQIAEIIGSKAQYERQFKYWNFRKNRKQREWAAAGRVIKKRKQDGKESAVYIDGVLVKMDKIRKETSRHDRPTYDQGSIYRNI